VDEYEDDFVPAVEIEDLEDNRGNLIGPGDPRVARS
jgi:hypothetical protein